MSYRTENGIPDIKNGVNKILQMQIDLMHEDVREIKDSIKVFGPICSKNETRSKMNTKITFVLIAGILTLGAAMVAAI